MNFSEVPSLAVLASSACLAGTALWPRRVREAAGLLRRGCLPRPTVRGPRSLAPPIPFVATAACLVAAFAAPLAGPWSWPLLPGGPLGLALLLLALFDARLYRLPDGLTLTLLLTGFGAAEDANRSLAGLTLWALLPFALDALMRRFKGRSGLGRGDVKLMAGVGAWLGPVSAATAIALAALMAAAATLVLAAVLRRPARSMPIAFGVFLALGLWWAWLAGAAR